MSLELNNLVEKIRSSAEFATIGNTNRNAFMKLIDALSLQGNDGITPMEVYPEVPYYNFREKKNKIFRHRLLKEPPLGEAWTPPSIEESYGMSDVSYAKMIFDYLVFDYEFRNFKN
jgi:hypothetical protein